MTLIEWQEECVLAVHLRSIINIGLVDVWVIVQVVPQDIPGLAFNNAGRGELNGLPLVSTFPGDWIILTINAKADILPVNMICPDFPFTYKAEALGVNEVDLVIDRLFADFGHPCDPVNRLLGDGFL